MTAREIFEHLAPILAPVVGQAFGGRRDLCVLATRVAIETAAYFGVEAKPLPVKVIIYNDSFARHVADDFAGVDRRRPDTWGDNSWSVGIGCGSPYGPGKWDGHLIAVADGCFGDFSIQQAERTKYSICTGPAVVGPYDGQAKWMAIEKTSGTVVEYFSGIADDTWRNAPDWKDAVRRRPLVGKLIRALRAAEVRQ